MCTCSREGGDLTRYFVTCIGVPATTVVDAGERHDSVRVFPVVKLQSASSCRAQVRGDVCTHCNRLFLEHPRLERDNDL